MDVLGVVLIVVGVFLNAYAGAIYRNGRKSVQQHSMKDQDEFMSLLGSGLKVLRIVGLVLMVFGAVIFLKTLVVPTV